MPACIELDGRFSSLDFRLCDHLGAPVPPVLRHAIRQGFDAAWVRARLPRVFGFTPGPAEVEKALLHEGFAAVTTDGAVCYPFACTDYYGRSALVFGADGPEAVVKRSIAEAFWGVLAREPEDLAVFEQRAHHPDAMAGYVYGCESGRVYRDEPGE